MRRLGTLVVAVLLCFVFVSTSRAETSSLLELLGNKDFWSNYTWGKFIDGELYRAAEWRPPGWPGRAGVTVTSCYTIEIPWPELGIEKLTLYEDSGVMRPFDDPKDLKQIFGTTLSSHRGEDYKKIVDWCIQKFGEPQKDVQSAEMKSSWLVGNTIVSVTTKDAHFLSKVLFGTKIVFEKNNQMENALRQKPD